jgi:type VI secretion system protein ImpM
MTRSDPLHYFGKLPSRGDFVRSAHSPSLTLSLDRWLSATLEAMAVDPRWKEVYDRAGPAHLAIFGPRSDVALAGHLIASHDASGRRFPFITASRCTVEASTAFVCQSPLRLWRPWQALARVGHQAVAEADAEIWLKAMGTLQVPAPSTDTDPSLVDFRDRQTLGSLETLLRAAGHEMDLRQSLLGLGLLLQPVPASGVSTLERGLWLPLPRDPEAQALVASWWLSLVDGFLGRAAFELLLLMPAQPAGAPPVAVLGFGGPAPRTLQAWLDPAAGHRVLIDLRASEWVEQHLGQDYAVHKLSRYLQQVDLSLSHAHTSFQECFLGR